MKIFLYIKNKSFFAQWQTSLRNKLMALSLAVYERFFFFFLINISAFSPVVRHRALIPVELSRRVYYIYSRKNFPSTTASRSDIHQKRIHTIFLFSFRFIYLRGRKFSGARVHCSFIVEKAPQKKKKRIPLVWPGWGAISHDLPRNRGEHVFMAPEARVDNLQ